MAAEQSEKSPCKSNFGGGWISWGQLIAESMCARIAKKQKKQLPYKFWEIHEWLKLFKFQLAKANQLLEKHSPQVIIEALKSPEGKRIYSLGAKGPILRLISRVQYANEQKRAVAEQVKAIEVAEDEAIRPTFIPKNNQIEKLRGL